MSSKASITAYPEGIFAIDTEHVRKGLAAAHLVVHSGRTAFIDTGTALAVPLLLKALDQLQLGYDSVDWLLLTHVHLDHAGGAGHLMRIFPKARAVVHPRGAAHLVNPTKLIAASISVYGAENYAALYRELLPIPEDRVHITRDGEFISLSGRLLEVLHTPGHALHHQAFFDYSSHSVFCGDTFGISYREFDVDGRAMILPTTTPTQFDPQQLINSINRLLSIGPKAAYLTHYSRVDELPRLGADLKQQIRKFEEFALEQKGRTHIEAYNAIRAAIRTLWFSNAQRHGCTLTSAAIDSLLNNDLDLNTDGLLAWLARRRL